MSANENMILVRFIGGCIDGAEKCIKLDNIMREIRIPAVAKQTEVFDSNCNFILHDPLPVHVYIPHSSVMKDLKLGRQPILYEYKGCYECRKKQNDPI